MTEKQKKFYLLDMGCGDNPYDEKGKNNNRYRFFTISA